MNAVQVESNNMNGSSKSGSPNGEDGSDSNQSDGTILYLGKKSAQTPPAKVNIQQNGAATGFTDATGVIGKLFDYWALYMNGKQKKECLSADIVVFFCKNF